VIIRVQRIPRFRKSKSYMMFWLHGQLTAASSDVWIRQGVQHAIAIGELVNAVAIHECPTAAKEPLKDDPIAQEEVRSRSGALCASYL
jgi:hypothetical protein